MKKFASVLVAASLGISVAAAGVASASSCDDEPIPSDVPVWIGSETNPPTVFVGADTGTGGGSDRVAACAGVFFNPGWSVQFEVRADPNLTATPGATVSPSACLDGFCSGLNFGAFGAEAGTASAGADGATVSGTTIYKGFAGNDTFGKTGLEIQNRGAPGVRRGSETLICVAGHCEKSIVVDAGSSVEGFVDGSSVGGSIPLCASVGTTCP
ncbi:MAG TPA: hypothetical protein VGB83_12430 [Actinomycetota bacterium]